MTALRSDTCATLSFGGRFEFGIDQWAYVPFDVPRRDQPNRGPYIPRTVLAVGDRPQRFGPGYLRSGRPPAG